MIATVGTPFASGSLDAWAVDRLHRDDPDAHLDADWPAAGPPP
ncbi:hypothetical protein [Streptomyces sp. QHH-9511]|nr:hypothetical protein [Streptomyces sp. QHH-9511]